MSSKWSWGIAAFALVLVCAVAFIMFDRAPTPDATQGNSGASGGNTPTTPPVLGEQVRTQVQAFCGDCHRVPLATSFPKDAWPQEVQRGYEFYIESGRQDLTVPNMQDVIDYYVSQAPDQLDVPAGSRPVDFGPITFRIQSLALTPRKAQISNVFWLAPTEDKAGQLLFSDMGSGEIRDLRWGDTLTALQMVQIPHPSRIQQTDLDANGDVDYLVGDLGTFFPGDHDKGQVVWVRRPTLDGAYEAVTLMDTLGRVADVRPADFDGDGDLDLVVAEFGWHKTGHVLWLENRSMKDGTPQFEKHVLDDRPGAIHVPVIDLNHDNRPDIIALISQEFEVVEAYINAGGGVFERRTIFAALDPSYGSSGIELTDLDQDSDLDLLLTNGDTFDSPHPKPFHGVQWLENEGVYPYTHHTLVDLPGAHRAVPADLDGDGDLDVVAGGFLPSDLRSSQPEPGYDALVWLEQTEPKQFVPHTMELKSSAHATLVAGDFDADGDPDLAVGNFGDLETVWLNIWWNEGRQP